MNTVLDPFVGSGTTPMVAMEFGLDYIGIDLSEENIRIAEDRISQRRNELDAGASN
jgi:DNA modification methylase